MIAFRLGGGSNFTGLRKVALHKHRPNIVAKSPHSLLKLSQKGLSICTVYSFSSWFTIAERVREALKDLGYCRFWAKRRRKPEEGKKDKRAPKIMGCTEENSAMKNRLWFLGIQKGILLCKPIYNTLSFLNYSSIIYLEAL